MATATLLYDKTTQIIKKRDSLFTFLLYQSEQWQKNVTFYLNDPLPEEAVNIEYGNIKFCQESGELKVRLGTNFLG